MKMVEIYQNSLIIYSIILAFKWQNFEILNKSCEWEDVTNITPYS